MAHGFYWAVLFLSATAAYSYHKLFYPRRLLEQPFVIVAIQRETDKTWTLKLQPRDAGLVSSYLPGQFHFVTFQCRDLPMEEHPFTISSSPTERYFVTSTIKESGNFTNHLNRARVGEQVLIRGAFGRFSYLLHGRESELVFVSVASESLPS